MPRQPKSSRLRPGFRVDRLYLNHPPGNAPRVRKVFSGITFSGEHEMKFQHNPFIRGFEKVTYRRTLLVFDRINSKLLELPLHKAQEMLYDEELAMQPCIFNESFVVLDRPDLPDGISGTCLGQGHVALIQYRLYGWIEGGSALIDTVLSQDDAETLHNFHSFETGYYSRCWEISTAHITKESLKYLNRLVYFEGAGTEFYEAFHLPQSEAFGVKLIATPWTERNLMEYGGITVETVCQRLKNEGMPDDLVNVLLLAAQADVRILVFDPSAMEVPGLAKY